MGLFGNRRPRPLVDDTLPGSAWISASSSAYSRTVSAYYGSPETMASGGEKTLRSGDVGVALFYFAKSIDMLHTAYGFSNMQDRTPGPQDAPIIDGYLDALLAVKQRKPDAPLAEPIRETTHRLRSISTTAEGVGIDAGRYRQALDMMANVVPEVPVDDILWY
ncbi:MAG: hypothetical protein AAGC46_06825 [Solirubrobacteraceae bacterium]|nr:hypothetical protein [Patulibacter sp.]